VHALVRQAQRPVLSRKHDRLADIAIAARVDVGLQGQPHDLAAVTL
jgi:hypothetical protein